MMRRMRRSTTKTTAQNDGNCVQLTYYTAIEKERGRGYQAASYNRFAMRECGCWASSPVGTRTLHGPHQPEIKRLTLG